ncbi:MAG: histidine utilization repressor [Aquabacterium sp.]
MVSPRPQTRTDRAPRTSRAAAAVSAPVSAPPAAGASAPYQQVKAHLHQGLQDGTWAPGALMPSEAALVAQFGVSRMTVNRALRELQAEGLVERVQGVGSFALQPHKAASTLTIRDLHEEIASRGHRHDAQVQLLREEPAGRDVARRLRLAEGTPVFHVLILHREDGMALQCEDRHVNPACAPDFLAQDFRTTTPTHHLLQVAPYWQAEVAIEAGRASAREARLLAIGRDDPCLIVTRRTMARGAVITTARLVHPGARYQIEASFQP